MDTFALDVARFVEKAKAAPGVALRKIGGELGRGVVMTTPVGNPTLWKSKPPKGYVGGRLRASWNASIGSPDFSVSQRVDKSGSETIARINAAFARATGEADIYLTTALPYARKIEYEGHSTQAPAGMVRITVAQFQRYVDTAVRSMK